MQISIDLPKVKVKKSSAAPSLNIYTIFIYSMEWYLSLM